MMFARSAPWLLVAAFAAALGHLAWHAVLGPPTPPNYFVGGETRVMASQRPEDKNLYLRRTLHLSQRPRHAWIQVLGRDLLLLHVNGQLVEQRELPSHAVVILADLTPNLRQGKNVIAITARQSGVRTPPVVAVTGAYTLSDGEHSLDADEPWRYGTTFERGAAWWFEPDFNDRHWPQPVVQIAHLRAEARMPPGAARVMSQAKWIGASEPDAQTIAVQGEIEIEGRPREGWLRVAATSSYRLAVNGILLDQQEDQLATAAPVPPCQRLYDITPVLQRGRNVVSLVLAATATPPRLQADAEVTTADGQRLALTSDERWRYRLGWAADWLNGAGSTGADWKPCRAEAGDLTLAAWDMPRQTVEVELPANIRAWRTAGQVGLMVLIGLLTGLVCRMVERLLGNRAAPGAPPRRIGGVYLALVPATAAIAFGVLALFDPRVAAQDVYRPAWLGLALGSVVLQWCALGLFRQARQTQLPSPDWHGLLRPLGAWAVLLVLVGVGFWLRWRDIETEPLHWDEVSVHTIAEGFRERGFPSSTMREGMPVVYLNTNELAHVFTGLSSLIFDDPRWVVRFPTICWSLLTLVMLYAMGADLFRTRLVGLTAAALFAFSPVVIAVSTFGRYFGPLQFFTLLTVWCLWHTIRGTGPLNHRALWLTAVSFVAVFLSWEGGGLIAPGLILAALVLRRGKLPALFRDPQLWLACLAVALVIGLQFSHRTLQQTQSIWSGISASDADMRPLWRYTVFQPWYYLFESSWNQDSFIPLLLLAGSGLLALTHPWRRPVRLLLVFHVTTCVVTASLLTIIAWRYIHHLVPVFILLAAATLTAGTHRLAAWTWRAARARIEVLHARLIAASVLVAVLAVGSGLTLQLAEMELFRVQGYGVAQFKYINIGGANLFLKDHVREGDVVLAHQPFTTNFFLERRRADYWLQSNLHMPETLHEQRPIAVDRRDGTPLLGSLRALEDLFASEGRIWYVAAPSGNSSANRSEVSAFLREHMDVVYEDYKTLVLFRDGNQRPAEMRAQHQRALRTASIDFLP